MTQGIWFLSRRKFCPCLKLPPPKGLDEIAYARLAFEKGCQLCCEKKAKVYWAFAARLCDTCFAINTITNHELREEKSLVNTNFLAGLPYVESHLYEHAVLFHSPPGDDRRHKWAVKQNRKCRRLMRQVKKRERLGCREKLKAIFHARLNNLEPPPEDKDTSLNLVFDIDLLRRCVSFRRSYGLSQELIDWAWIELRRSLVKEYQRVLGVGREGR
ncbi:2709_t:CDS:2 [Ambispora leptoticha]|uniref:2709_t:CDS:1 n=1 Tax=Ambispora leptoticha TaxID=144679 RepID=A0A9N9GJY7_9GLOM|nr:2709_t:CDS:2 [Ambispora leptoticha]